MMDIIRYLLQSQIRCLRFAGRARGDFGVVNPNQRSRGTICLLKTALRLALDRSGERPHFAHGSTSQPIRLGPRAML
jgi:hypothetical protein